MYYIRKDCYNFGSFKKNIIEAFSDPETNYKVTEVIKSDNYYSPKFQELLDKSEFPTKCSIDNYDNLVFERFFYPLRTASELTFNYIFIGMFMVLPLYLWLKHIRKKYNIQMLVYEEFRDRSFFIWVIVIFFNILYFYELYS